MRIAIIGTAGRKDDADRMSKTLYVAMVRKSIELIADVPLEERHLKSGGAAWADHVAVTLFLQEQAESLWLGLPCEWDFGHKAFQSEKYFDTGHIANHYHRMFSERMGTENHTSLRTINSLITAGNERFSYKTYNGFLNRNLVVGDCDRLIAFTFSNTGFPKDGGTSHTWKHSKAPEKIHVNLFDLNIELMRHA